MPQKPRVHNTHSMAAISMLVGRVDDEYWTCFDYSVPVISFIVVPLHTRHGTVKWLGQGQTPFKICAFHLTALLYCK